MVAKRFSGKVPDSPITSPPNWTTQKPSRLEIDALTTAFEDGYERGRDALLVQIASVVSPDMLNHIIRELDTQAVQG